MKHTTASTKGRRLPADGPGSMEMGEATVLAKGQVVIPVGMRRHLGLKPGVKVIVREKDGDLVLTPRTKGLVDKMAGFLKDDRGKLTKAWKEYRREEAGSETRKLGRWGVS